MELLVINDKYPDDYLAVFAKNGIRYPKEGEVVELLRVVKYTKLSKGQGRTGFVIKPYENQYLRGENFGVKAENEVDFNSERFVHLDGTPLTKEEIEKLRVTKEVDKIIIPIKPKENEKL